MATMRYYLCSECGSAFDEQSLTQDGHAANCIECMTKPSNPIIPCDGPYTKGELRRAMKEGEFKIPAWLRA